MLRIKQLRKHYHQFTLDCSLEVKPGYITGLIGQNGAGKSTTFKALLGLISFEEGDITILGKDIHQFNCEDKENLGVVLSDSGFSGYLTIQDLFPILKNLYKKFDEIYFTHLIHQFQLPLNKKIKDFSTGMKAKFKLIVALSHHARLLILDEPTSGLDVIARDEILELLREFMEQDDNRSILISSHISSDLEALCDDIYMIHDGKIILHEQSPTLMDHYALLKMNESQYELLDKQYILRMKKEAYGYSCLTNQRQFYLDNYPDYTIEKATIDQIITMMIKGVSL